MLVYGKNINDISMVYLSKNHITRITYIIGSIVYGSTYFSLEGIEVFNNNIFISDIKRKIVAR